MRAMLGDSRYRLHEAAERAAAEGTAGHAALALQLGYRPGALRARLQSQRRRFPS
jgi:hypothetical protein